MGAAAALAGTVYGVAFHLDPTTPGPVAWALHGGLAMTFAALGAGVVILSLAVVCGLQARRPWALHGAVGLAVVYLVCGLVPSAAVILIALSRHRGEGRGPSGLP
jgi:hypothetical protein